MSEPFLSEIKIVSFNFPPKGWALCNGQFLPINQNQALFALLGTTYGGNAENLRYAEPARRVPIHSALPSDRRGAGAPVTVNISNGRRTPRQRRRRPETGPRRAPDGPSRSPRPPAASAPVADVNIYSTSGGGPLVALKRRRSPMSGAPAANNMIPI